MVAPVPNMLSNNGNRGVDIREKDCYPAFLNIIVREDYQPPFGLSLLPIIKHQPLTISWEFPSVIDVNLSTCTGIQGP